MHSFLSFVVRGSQLIQTRYNLHRRRSGTDWSPWSTPSKRLELTKSAFLTNTDNVYNTCNSNNNVDDNRNDNNNIHDDDYNNNKYNNSNNSNNYNDDGYNSIDDDDNNNNNNNNNNTNIKIIALL